MSILPDKRLKIHDASVDGEPQGNCRWTSNIPETQLKALLPFPSPTPEHPGEFARRLMILCPGF